MRYFYSESTLSDLFPLIWKQAKVISVPKVYTLVATETEIKPISLSPKLSKVLELFVGLWIRSPAT
jgi:hypothetical protein